MIQILKANKLNLTILMDGQPYRLYLIIWYAPCLVIALRTFSDTHKIYYNDRILHINVLLVIGPTSHKEQASSAQAKRN